MENNIKDLSISVSDSIEEVINALQGVAETEDDYKAIDEYRELLLDARLLEYYSDLF